MSDPIPETGNPVKGLTKKIGPLPAYMYAVIIVGVAYAVYWWKNRVGVAQPEVVTNVGSGMSSAGPMPGTNDYSGTVGSATHAPAASATNAQWAKNVADGMIASGSSPVDVTGAIAKYLTGGTLNTTQQAVINTALRTYGNPPEGVIAVSVEPTKPFFWQFQRNDVTGAIFGVTQDHQSVPLTYEDWVGLGAPQENLVHYSAGDGTPAPTEFFKFLAPPGGHKYTVKDGDTWEGIAQSFYGTNDGSAISAANPGRQLTPGTVLTIPEK
jgi:hypothetical protein